ncbi:hypothetical protein SERLADRAFT_411939 [Serpula lacrymans var. lacrymans S7.9]|uniref:F-box domain-containing protein n=1 Tax=Serpula lacrymans var. lacrymans (strain S7.9) TaxID=578457 RepID=F8PCU4_SERL9|nr:uncharacterized protein SERLADRAFT_411939 [Serpula lacrymans var. lacrymans S7.9]EGO19043.1 hypothetical protein SERLADRAFT_411939 [Serpula lacrymans var. lacrymans S7.9]
MHIPGAWDVRVHLPLLPSLSTLSDDILVDHVFVYLTVEDILSLRTVSRLYYNLSHQGIIWKRFLQSLGYEAPPLPPSTRYALHSITSFEAERLVTRALTLRQNWMSPEPVAKDLHCFRAYRQILSMVALPGGKHLVASVSNPDRNHFSLVVYVLDHRVGGVVPLAETPVKRKAYDLRVKYMTIEGVRSIVIAFNRRKFSKRYQKETTINPSSYNTLRNNPLYGIDSPAPFRYTCSCMQVPLDALDALADPRYPPGSMEFFEFARSQPPPFRLISLMRSTSELGPIDLAEVQGRPCMAVVKKPRFIVFKDLSINGRISTLTCANTLPNSFDLPGPSQPSIPILPGPPARDPEGLCNFAMFPIPPPGQDERYSYAPQSILNFRFRDIENVQISDPNLLPVGNSSGPTQALPPPIHIFLRRSKGTELYHALIPPTPPAKFPFPSIFTPYYSLDNIRRMSAHTFSGVPADNRTESPPLVQLYSHFVVPEDEVDDVFTQKDSPIRAIKRNIDVARNTPIAKLITPQQLRSTMKQGVMAIAWDEGIGRIFFATSHDTRLYILDVAKAPKEDKTGQRLPLPLEDERMLEL